MLMKLFFIMMAKNSDKHDASKMLPIIAIFSLLGGIPVIAGAIFVFYKIAYKFPDMAKTLGLIALGVLIVMLILIGILMVIIKMPNKKN